MIFPLFTSTAHHRIRRSQAVTPLGKPEGEAHEFRVVQTYFNVIL
jgi:hypothetical protein